MIKWNVKNPHFRVLVLTAESVCYQTIYYTEKEEDLIYILTYSIYYNASISATLAIKEW